MSSKQDTISSFKEHIRSAVATVSGVDILTEDSEHYGLESVEHIFPNSSIYIQFSSSDSINTKKIMNVLPQSLRKSCIIRLSPDLQNIPLSDVEPQQIVQIGLHRSLFENINESNSYCQLSYSISGIQKELLLEQLDDFCAIHMESNPSVTDKQPLYAKVNEDPENFTIKVREELFYEDRFQSSLSFFKYICGIGTVTNISDDSGTPYIRLTMKSIYSSFEDIAQVDSPVLKERSRLFRRGIKLVNINCLECGSSSLSAVQSEFHYCKNCNSIFTKPEMSHPRIIQSDSFEEVKQKLSESLSKINESFLPVKIPDPDFHIEMDNSSSAAFYFPSDSDLQSNLTILKHLENESGIVIQFNGINVAYSLHNEDLILDSTEYSHQSNQIDCLMCESRFESGDLVYSGPLSIQYKEQKHINISSDYGICDSCVGTVNELVEKSIREVGSENILVHTI